MPEREDNNRLQSDDQVEVTPNEETNITVNKAKNILTEETAEETAEDTPEETPGETTEEKLEVSPFTEEELVELEFYSIRTGDPATVESILDKDNPIEVQQLNVFKDKLENGKVIFIVLGGDKSKPWVTWETGLIGIASVDGPPYDVGYHKRNFKLKINVDILLEHNLKRDNLIPYITTYNLPGIGPLTRGEPNQALSAINGIQAVNLVRAILDKFPGVEEELTRIFGERFMLNVKGEIPYLIEQAISFQDRMQQLAEEEEQDEEEPQPHPQSSIYSNLYDPDLSVIKGSLEMDVKPIEYFKNYINIHKNIILTGPPGTGKTTIAERAAEEGVRTNYIDGYILSTATDDWSTFDTIGGYMPDPNQAGKLRFHEGIVLKSIKENKWLIIDEINRADIDKAFGQLFTVLSGKNVELPFESNNQPVKIKHHDRRDSYYDSSTCTYYIGQNWRLVGTMNTFDKNSLFAFSYAFMRRFAFIEIPIPDLTFYSNLINVSNLTQLNKDFINKLVEVTPKALGPAIIIELMKYINVANNTSRIEAICGTVIPQYEGLDHNDIHELYRNIGILLSENEREIFKRFVSDFFELPNNFFRNADIKLIPTEIEESNEDDETDLQEELIGESETGDESIE